MDNNPMPPRNPSSVASACSGADARQADKRNNENQSDHARNDEMRMGLATTDNVAQSRGRSGDGQSITIGQRWDDGDGPARVMTFAEGYVMMRRKGCVPFLVYWREFPERWRLVKS